MKNIHFASVTMLNVFARWGKIGLFFYLVYKGMKNLISRESTLFEAGWHDPISPIIARKVYGQEFRIVTKKNRYPFSSFKIVDKTGGKVSEDIYPLV